MKARLTKLAKKSDEKQDWAVAMCARRLIELPDELDCQINLVGALQEAGCLRNVIKPYWGAYRGDGAQWAGRCIERLAKVHDHDYWAVAAMLGLPRETIENQLLRQGYTLFSKRKWDRLKGPNLHLATYSQTKQISEASRVIAPVVEIGWDEKTGEVLQVARWRAILITEFNDDRGRFWGKGSGSYCLQARLPYGVWRLANEEFQVFQETLL